MSSQAPGSSAIPGDIGKAGPESGSNCDVVLLPREPVHHEEVHGELKSHH